MQDPSIQDNPLCKQCNTSTCYAAPVVQPHLLCKQCKSTSCYAAPIMQSTCYAKHLLMQSTSSKLPAKEPLPSRNAHQNALTQTRNLSKFRPNFSLNFLHKPTQISYLNHNTSRANKQTYTHEMLCNLLNCPGPCI